MGLDVCYNTLSSELTSARDTVMTITHTTTIDGRMISLADLEKGFDAVCEFMRNNDPEWTWKESISYEFPYTSAEMINDVQSAIVHYVGGKCHISMYTTNGVHMVSVTNAGYYKNIGA